MVVEVGDDEATFAGLYPRLRRLAAVAAPLEVDPDDLVQDALVRVLRRGPLADLDDPGAYLAKVIVNLASNSRRGLGRRRRAGHAARGAQHRLAADAVPGRRLVVGGELGLQWQVRGPVADRFCGEVEQGVLWGCLGAARLGHSGSAANV